ncbi:hypothetical protein BOTBODRAFT_111099 [Botryobasidium botryosum FD-172 SS1]|uniref:NACHT domain-containing protein n=1 Tax=Botryobasidium botryosum (strain FD-172 SS1) TaxID=930990 RepID=A0A067MCW6_BOTB1|nr:hypothetical protein BOTBODRAFT_111099 [Botryobasidium botryosum FD-172 SS1]
MRGLRISVLHPLSISIQLPPASVISLRVFHDGTFHDTFLCRAAIEIDELLKSSADNSGMCHMDFSIYYCQSQTSAPAQLDVVLKLLPSANGGATITIHPIINVAWQVVHGLYQIPKNQLDRDDKVVRLIARIRDLYATVRALDGVGKIAELESIIEAILQQTIECVLFIREYVGLGFGTRVLHQTISSTDAKIKEFEDALRDLEAAFRNRSLVHITLVTTRVSNRVEKMYILIDLMGQLTPVDMETFDLPRCQPGTRSGEIQWITEWVMDPDADQRILWLPGPAGFGKSTLSATLADTFASLRRLGAFLFFSRDVEERSTPSKVVRTLAYQLALFDHRIADKVSKLLDESPFMARSHVRSQLAQLIVKPLCSVEALDDDGPLVIILDALDECGDVESRRSLLTALAAESRHLPSCVRILITSRPSDDIASAFDKQPHVKCRSLEITAENLKDVKAFLRHSLAQIAQSRRHLTLDPGWPGCPVLRVLTTRAGGLFIWADTAVKYMDDGMNPVQRLDVLVSGATPKDRVDSLSQLYATVLHACQKWDDEEFCSAFCKLFGAILMARLPLSPSAMDSLLSLPPNWALQMTSYFRAVLIEEPTGAIHIIHPSFYDFLTSQSQAGSPWYINAQLHSKYMAFHCVDLLGLTLRENMLGLVHSLRPAPIPNLSLDIAYACLFWIPHVCAIGGELESLGDSIYQLLHTHLLHWLEAMCISKESRKALHMLHQLESWTQSHLPDHTSLCDLVSDSLKFCRYFSNVIEQHPLSVYQVALPFSPSQSLVYKAFHRDDAMPKVSGSPLSVWPPWQLTLAGHKFIQCMALSPDGLRIATGGKQESNAYIWDLMTGSLILGPLQGHENQVWSVSFSLDGTRLVTSGYKDIFVWDAITGILVFKPFGAHLKTHFASTAFSSDGLRLVSGSTDKAVYVWDVLTGLTSLGPLWHERAVTAVSFSLNASHIVSGSDNGAIHIWDAVTGAQLHAPLKRHSLGVTSVGFSPDGSLIVSGSYDQTVCLSNVATGNLILGPLVGGFTTGVCMVSFLPDGSKFISGSTNGVLSFWDMQSGTLLLDSKNHQGGVRAAAFSYDGMKVASASEDKTICIWDAKTGIPLVGPLSGHTDGIYSVAFSPDGLRVASGSGVINIWDAATGASLGTYGQLQPDQGHYSAMRFSPDGSKLSLFSMQPGPSDIAVAWIWVWDSLREVNLESFSLTPGPDQLDVHSPSFGMCAGVLQLALKYPSQRCFEICLQATEVPKFGNVRGFSICAGAIAVILIDGSVAFVHFPPSHPLHYNMT